MYGLTRAPSIDRPDLQWFNVPRPLSLADLRGRLVILDFWTSCCVNCLHVQPTLGRIRRAFPGQVVVIGVHSPKFTAERDPESLRHAIARAGITHPVVHDPDMSIGKEYCVRAWPTLVFVAPDGMILGDLRGEPDAQRVIDGIGMMMRTWKEDGLLKPPARGADPAAPATRAADGEAALRYPGKIRAAHRHGERLWAIADTGHHRILVADDGGAIRAVYGRGQAGHLDGPADRCAFSSPQGLDCDEDFIYVADTGNHALRRIDRATGAVATLAGAGRRGCALRTPAKGADTALASPWDVILAHGRLLFANAGTHQIGQMCLTSGYVEPLAGNAREGLCDGPALDAVLAQPSGLALSADGMALYVADSETSAIRRVGLGADARVDTLVGKGLFDFGHVNGPLCAARLQHATGLAFCDGAVLVADSYNHRLRSLDLAAGRMTDLDLPGGVALHEPSGLVADGPHRLLVSDTNNHRILEIDRAAGTVHTWMGGPSGSVGESVEESGAKTPCR